MFEEFLKKYPFFRYIPAILGMALLFRSSSITGEGMSWLMHPFDKIIHASVYACLGLAFSLWHTRNTWISKYKRSFLISFGLSLLYGAFDEIHQSFVPGRSAGLDDLAADAIGSFFGVLLYLIYVKFGQKH